MQLFAADSLKVQCLEQAAARTNREPATSSQLGRGPAAELKLGVRLHWFAAQ